ncbi:hypothetical protein ACFQZ4_10035 [Catellatospora coxensis]
MATTPAPPSADTARHDLALTIQRLFAALRRLSPPGISLSAAATLATLEREGRGGSPTWRYARASPNPR